MLIILRFGCVMLQGLSRRLIPFQVDPIKVDRIRLRHISRPFLLLVIMEDHIHRRHLPPQVRPRPYMQTARGP